MRRWGSRWLAGSLSENPCRWLIRSLVSAPLACCKVASFLHGRAGAPLRGYFVPRARDFLPLAPVCREGSTTIVRPSVLIPQAVSDYNLLRENLGSRLGIFMSCKCSLGVFLVFLGMALAVCAAAQSDDGVSLGDLARSLRQSKAPLEPTAPDRSFPDLPADTAWASGASDQRIFILRRHRMVVSVANETDHPMDLAALNRVIAVALAA